MQVTQKSLYALRAVFELAKYRKQGPKKIADIASAQAIPQRFLESILSQLKQAGFVESCRGNDGGYVLIRPPKELTVGQVMEFIQGPVGPTACLINKSRVNECSLRKDCIFMGMWKKIHDAILDVYNNTTFYDLMKQPKAGTQSCVTSGHPKTRQKAEKQKVKIN
jgi:Rrf2 family cysteine metabolism transcriptional repressor